MMPPRQKQVWLAARLALFCALLLLAGCSRHRERADLVILNGAEPETLDPHLFTGQPEGRAIGAMFEGLTRYDPKTGEPVPGLAERWEVSSNRLTYTFYMRSNAVWSTGEPITAHDFVYSWRRLVNPATGGGYAGALFQVRNAEAIAAGKVADLTQLGAVALDARRLRVELNSPAAFFLDMCAYRPLAAVPRRAVETHGDRWLLAKPMPVSGAYHLESWDIHDRIRLRKNPRYWDAANTRCEVVDLLPLESPPTALNLFLAGQADVIWDKSLIPSELLDRVRQEKYCHAFDYLGTYFLRLNTTHPPLNDPRVRQALVMAVDRQRVIDRVVRGGEKAATRFTPPGTRNYAPPEGLPHDPERARQLLAEAGYPGGRGLRVLDYLINASRSHEQVAIELREMWQRELGVTIQIRQTEYKVYYADQDKLNYDLCRGSWVGDYNDANTFLDVFLSNNSNNRTGWKNQRYDQLLSEANQQLDSARRAALLREAETLLVREGVPILPLYFYKGYAFYDPDKIEGIWFNLIDEHPIQAIGRKTGG